MNDVSAVYIDGHKPIVAEARLAYAACLVDRRLSALRDAGDGALLPPAWKQQPAFQVHVTGGLRELLADEDYRAALRHIIMHGREAHVVTFVHGDLDEVSAALAKVSTRLAAELMEGRALRCASTGAGTGVMRP